MKSTTRLIDNLINDEFRKAKVDLQMAVNHIIKQRVATKKKEVVAQMNEK